MGGPHGLLSPMSKTTTFRPRWDLMKARVNTPDRLELHYFPWAMLLIGLTFVVLFTFAAWASLSADETRTGRLFFFLGTLPTIAFLAFVVRRVQLIFDRHTGTVTLRRTVFFRRSERQWPLDDFLYADTQSSFSGDTEVVRAALHLNGEDQPVPVTRAFTSGTGSAEVAETINGWAGTAPAR